MLPIRVGIQAGRRDGYQSAWCSTAEMATVGVMRDEDRTSRLRAQGTDRLWYASRGVSERDPAVALFDPAAELVAAATRHDSLGWSDVGQIAIGQRADLVNLATDSPTTAGTGASYESVAMATSAYDVRRVWIDGVRRLDGDRAQVGADLTKAIEEVRR